MIKRILMTLFIVIVVVLLLAWVLTGGIQRAWYAGTHLSSPFAAILGNASTTGALITLPWQIAPPQGPDVSKYLADQRARNQEAAQNMNSAENTIGSTFNAQLGNPSPYAGEVAITSNAATERDPAKQYIAVGASSGNASSIDITGWSLQSAVSGLRIPIPQAAPVFLSGTVNTVADVRLDPGATAIITTGVTPVGTSFRENICSGYLQQFQSFDPSFTSTCPDPSQSLPETPENLRTYGGSCYDYVKTLSRCTIPQQIPTTLTSACQQFVANTYSYNGCVHEYVNDPSFLLPAWRIFLNLNAPLWYGTHDIVRLLDRQGRVVDVLTY